MIVRELLASYGLKLDESSFGKAQAATDSLKESLTHVVEVLGIIEIAKTFRDLIMDTITATADLDDFANKIGVTAQAIQELRYAAKLSGIETEAFDHSLTILTKTAAEAMQGSADAAKTFQQFGIKLKGANGQVRSSDDLLLDIADAAQKAKTQTERLGIAVKFFGERQGSKFAILMKDGAAGIKALREEANELGGVMGPEMIAMAAQADDNFDRLRTVIGGVKASITEALLPTILDLQERTIRWAKANKDLIKLKVKDWVDALIGAGYKLYKVMSAVWSIVSGIVQLFGGLGNVIKILGFALGVYLVNMIGASVLALGELSFAISLAQVKAVAMSLLAGAAFITLATIIFLIGEEIAAAFDPKKLGFFEAMQGKWGDLADKAQQSIEGTDGQFGKLGYTALAVISMIAEHIDGFFDSLFNQFTMLGDIWSAVFTEIDAAPIQLRTAWNDFFKWIEPKIQAVENLFDKISHFDNDSLIGLIGQLPGINAVVSGGNAGISAAASLTAGARAAVSNSVSVTVDAAGQTFDQQSLASTIREHIDDALGTANRQTMEALTPSAGGG